jgi:hypothetical protein
VPEGSSGSNGCTDVSFSCVPLPVALAGAGAGVDVDVELTVVGGRLVALAVEDFVALPDVEVREAE